MNANPSIQAPPSYSLHVRAAGKPSGSLKRVDFHATVTRE